MNNTYFTTAYIVVFFIFISFTEQLSAQQATQNRLMFYNVENLFDTVDDPATNDEEFLPEGEKSWSQQRLYKKINNTYRVIIHCGAWEPPIIVGLCEVENRMVLNKLVYETPLEKFNYRVIHFESPDRRGIDVALLYRGNHFQPDTAYPLHVDFPFDSTAKTRDVLYVKGRINNKETLHLFVNHWPSRYGGYQATVAKRNRAAEIVRNAVDSLIRNDGEPNIVIMGDFNDGPMEPSLLTILGASVDTTESGSFDLFNLTATYENDDQQGTLKYKENWDVFDQLIVSRNLLKKGPGLKIAPGGAYIFQPHYLCTDDEKYLGKKPFRTYAGFRYLGGFSDHLPVYLDLMIE